MCVAMCTVLKHLSSAHLRDQRSMLEDQRSISLGGLFKGVLHELELTRGIGRVREFTIRIVYTEIRRFADEEMMMRYQ